MFMKKKKKIYFAGTWKDRAKIRGWMDELEAVGFEITTDWTWHDSSDPAKLIKFAKDDKKGIESCDIFIMDGTHRSLGKHWEFGAASALKKEIYLVHESTCIFCHLVPDENKFESFNELLEHLKRRYPNGY